MIAAALEGGQPDLGDINENEAHDFLYARDCARAMAMIHCARKPKHAVYNIGSGQLTNFGDVARVLERICPGSRLKLGTGQVSTPGAIDYIPKTQNDIEACLDISRIREEFGFVPQYDLEKGLAALLAWVRDAQYL